MSSLLRRSEVSEMGLRHTKLARDTVRVEPLRLVIALSAASSEQIAKIFQQFRGASLVLNGVRPSQLGSQLDSGQGSQGASKHLSQSA
jgi:hypothetical protein